MVRSAAVRPSVCLSVFPIRRVLYGMMPTAKSPVDGTSHCPGCVVDDSSLSWKRFMIETSLRWKTNRNSCLAHEYHVHLTRMISPVYVCQFVNCVV